MIGGPPVTLPKRQPPLLPPAKIFPIQQSLDMTVESSSSDNDEDEDDDLTNTTTTTTDSVASTSSKSGAANVPTTRTVSATVPNIEIGTDVKPSSSLSTHKLFSPSKADKKPKIEIKSTLLADWSDHYTSEDDEEKSLPPPPPTPPSTLPVQALATTTETNQNIPSTAVELTSENKPKYRNIPKKDRRADVLREFYTDVSAVATPPSTSDAVLKVPTVVSKRESNVIVLDSDDSDTDKMSIKMEKTIGSDSKMAPPDGDSKTEPNHVAILSDAVKPIKKRDIGRQQLEMNAVMDETNGQLETITDETLATTSSSVIVTVNTPTQSEQINISQSDEMVAIGSVTPTTGYRIRGRKKEDTVRPTSRRSGRIKGLENGMFLSFMFYLKMCVVPN